MRITTSKRRLWFLTKEPFCRKARLLIFPFITLCFLIPMQEVGGRIFRALLQTNVIIAVGVTYYLTQRKSDDRKTKEFIFDIVDQIQQYALQPSLYTFKDIPPEQKILLLNIRHIRSKIDVLKQYAEKYGYQKVIEDLENNFDSFQNLMAIHYADIDYLKKSTEEIA